ncbi:MAG TPA: hypothetical protein VMV95_03015 [Bacillota bacterium]|nr:hypothetical protein [Bacillota bacterium]
MIFVTRNAVTLILNGEKTQTRRLVKDGDYFVTHEGINWEGNQEQDMGIYKVKSKWKNQKIFGKDRTKYEIPKSYCVQLGRGKLGLWYCPKCKKIYDTKYHSIGKAKWKVPEGNRFCGSCIKPALKPLRIKITDIRKEGLLDITEEDIKKEGFESKDDFLVEFAQINFASVPSKIKSYRIPWREGKARIRRDKIEKWNPKVWVLKFKVEMSKE